MATNLTSETPCTPRRLLSSIYSLLNTPPHSAQPATIPQYAAASTPVYASQAPVQQLPTPASTTWPLSTFQPHSTTTGLHRKPLEETVVSPSALYVKTKRRLRYTNRLKAEVLSFWLQPIITNHRSGHRTLQEVAQHTKIPLETLRGWTRKEHREQIFAAEAGLRDVVRDVGSPPASSRSSLASSSSSPASQRFTALDPEPSQETSITTTPDRRMSQRKRTQPQLTGVSTRATTRCLQQQAEEKMENQVEEGRQLRPRKRKRW